MTAQFTKFIPPLAVALFLGAMIGCGGGGGAGSTNASASASASGSGSSTGTSTTGTSTTGTSTTGTSTTGTSTTGSSTTTAATTGTVGGLPPDVILFNDNDGTTNQILQMNPDGSNVTTFDTLPAKFGGYAISSGTGKVAFGYNPSGGLPGSYSLYVNSSVSLTGAVEIDAGPYLSITSIQFTPDGSKVVYVANSLTFGSALYVANSNGAGTPVLLDSADDASLSPSGLVVVYSKSVSGTGEICRRSVDKSHFVQMTHNSDEDILPQWSKEGDRVYFSSDSTGFYNIWSIDPDGKNPVQVTADIDTDFSCSPNTGDTEVAFAKIAHDSAFTGIYKTDLLMSDPIPLYLSPNIKAFLYWTRTNGRSPGSAPGPWLGMSDREQRLIYRR